MNDDSRLHRLAHSVTSRDTGDADTGDGAESVLPLELFFDLVFVLGVTQVTTLMTHDPSWTGVGHGVLILALLWWAWTAYAWLTNTIDPDQELTRIAMFVAMGAMLVASMALPRVFDGDAVVFGVAYFVLRAVWAVLFALAAREDGDANLAAAVRGLTPYALVAPALVIVGCLLDPDLRAWAFLVAIVVDMAGPYLQPTFGWRVQPAHFAERHGLFILIALGESIVAIGVAGSGVRLDAAVIVAALLGVVLAASLWWMYFDLVAVVAERRLCAATGESQARLARDGYSVLHLPMVAGIVLLAFGVKATIAHTGGHLPAAPAFALCGGVSIYLLGHISFRLRSARTLNRQRLLVAAILLALIPVTTAMDALDALVLVAAVTAGLVAYETVTYGERRRRFRASVR